MSRQCIEEIATGYKHVKNCSTFLVMKWIQIKTRSYQFWAKMNRIYYLILARFLRHRHSHSMLRWNTMYGYNFFFLFWPPLGTWSSRPRDQIWAVAKNLSCSCAALGIKSAVPALPRRPDSVAPRRELLVALGFLSTRGIHTARPTYRGLLKHARQDLYLITSAAGMSSPVTGGSREGRREGAG